VPERVKEALLVARVFRFDAAVLGAETFFKGAFFFANFFAAVFLTAFLLFPADFLGRAGFFFLFGIDAVYTVISQLTKPKRGSHRHSGSRMLDNMVVARRSIRELFSWPARLARCAA
jgi:general stress protein CsbA